MHSEPGCPSCLFCNGVGNASELRSARKQKGGRNATWYKTSVPLHVAKHAFAARVEGQPTFPDNHPFALIARSANMLNCNRYSLRPVMRPYIAFVGRRSSRPHKDANCGRLVSLPADDGERLRPAPRVGKEPCSRPQRGQIHQARAKPWLPCRHAIVVHPNGVKQKRRAVLIRFGRRMRGHRIIDIEPSKAVSDQLSEAHAINHPRLVVHRKRS